MRSKNSLFATDLNKFGFGVGGILQFLGNCAELGIEKMISYNSVGQKLVAYFSQTCFASFGGITIVFPLFASLFDIIKVK
jgi:hypothetical protein